MTGHGIIVVNSPGTQQLVFPVDDTVDELVPGQLVYLTSSGTVKLFTATEAAQEDTPPLGIVADFYSNGNSSGKLTPWIVVDQVTQRVRGVKREAADPGNASSPAAALEGNRIKLNEVAAAQGRVTVITGPAVVYTRNYAEHDDGAWAPGTALFVDGDGAITDTAASGTIWQVGKLLADKVDLFTTVDANWFSPKVDLGVIKWQLAIDRMPAAT